MYENVRGCPLAGPRIVQHLCSVLFGKDVQKKQTVLKKKERRSGTLKRRQCLQALRAALFSMISRSNRIGSSVGKKVRQQFDIRESVPPAALRRSTAPFPSFRTSPRRLTVMPSLRFLELQNNALIQRRERTAIPRSDHFAFRFEPSMEKKKKK